MPNHSELEKTQLEIAKLQLEQERHKLLQMQKRQTFSSDLGSGVKAIGIGITKGASSALRWCLTFVGWLILAFTLGMVILAALAAWEAQRSADFDWWYGTLQRQFMWIAGVAGVLGGLAFSGRKTLDKSTREALSAGIGMLIVFGVIATNKFSPVPQEAIVAADRQAYNRELARIEQAHPRLNPDSDRFDAALEARVQAKLNFLPNRPAKEALRAAVESELGVRAR